MNTRDALLVATRALVANPLRAVLTTLGIIIGVAAVIATVSIGTGAGASIQQQITALGTNLLTVFPGRIQTPFGIGQGAGSVQTLRAEDGEAVAEAIPGVAAVTAELSRTAQVVGGTQNDNIRISGVTPSFPTVRTWPTAQGTFFEEEEMRSRARVAVIGSTVAGTFFPETDPVGQTLRINRVPFTVIGVLQTKGSTPGPQGDQDNAIFVPLTTAQRRLFGADSVGSLSVKVREADQMTAVMEEVRGILRTQHGLREGATMTSRSATRPISCARFRARCRPSRCPALRPEARLALRPEARLGVRPEARLVLRVSPVPTGPSPSRGPPSAAGSSIGRSPSSNSASCDRCVLRRLRRGRCSGLFRTAPRLVPERVRMTRVGHERGCWIRA